MSLAFTPGTYCNNHPHLCRYLVAHAKYGGNETAEMQTLNTFANAGRDLVDETANGTEDIWRIGEGKGCLRLWWELIPENRPSRHSLER